MNILSLDTSSETMSLALKTDSKILSLSFKIGLKHSTTLLPWISRIVKEAGIEAASLSLIVCSIGPGSFTGLRIGLSTAKGIVMGSEKSSIVGISTPDSLAYRFNFFRGVTSPVINARKNRFYTAFYRSGERITDYLDVSTEDFFKLYKENVLKDTNGKESLLLTGPDAGSLFNYAEQNLPSLSVFLDRGFRFAAPYSLLKAGVERFNRNGGDDPAGIVPLYIRKSEAEIKMIGE
ncbi:MAG: tRNA (adenosine(37)-N6)-threonylcarbamoyltransferase complex dimerization subunit type 1 TsaB [Spirochaetes bacterium]|nr:MAG: tRNA (adenosine(37)-N6)-threonylcarbamoyltransferase complex dimerization subunit type 1 TsaB [Spirochaetota bacterium]